MTKTADTTRAARLRESEAVAEQVVDASLDERIERMLAEPTATPAPPSALLTPPDADPIFRIGAQMGRLVARHSELDHEDVGTPHPAAGRKAEIERMMGRIDDRLALLREAASYQIATSLPGALAHLVVATQAVNDMVENGDLDADGREDRAQAARRCLYSVAHVLAATSGLSPRLFGSDYMMPDYADAMALAMDASGRPVVPDGPKPTLPEGLAPGLVERQLVVMNERAGVLWSLFHEAGRMEDDNSHNPDNDPVRTARRKMGGMAEGHARRRWTELLRHALELPTTTPREFGLLARLIAVEINDWWDDDNRPFGELALRTMLGRLAAFSGLPLIERPDVEPAEIRDWIDRPEVHAQEYYPELRK